MKKPSFISVIYTLLFGLYIYWRWDHFEWDLFLQPGLYMGIILILWPVHIFLEGQKWRVLLGKQLNIQEAAVQVLCGYSTALLTPGQWGHFVGRKWLQPKESWSRITGKTLLSGFWQSWAYISLAAFSLWILPAPDQAEFLWQFFKYLTLIVAFIGLVAVFLFAERLKNAIGSSYRNKFLKFFVNTIEAMVDSSKEQHLELLLWSVSKAGVVYLQFALVLSGMVDQWLGIPIIFMALTLLPLPPILGMIARGELILQIWHWLEWPSEDAYAGIYLLWMVNVLFSAILGTIVLFFRNKAERL